jgi:hypothetical protein
MIRCRCACGLELEARDDLSAKRDATIEHRYSLAHRAWLWRLEASEGR